VNSELTINDKQVLSLLDEQTLDYN